MSDQLENSVHEIKRLLDEIEAVPNRKRAGDQMDYWSRLLSPLIWLQHFFRTVFTISYTYRDDRMQLKSRYYAIRGHKGDKFGRSCTPRAFIIHLMFVGACLKYLLMASVKLYLRINYNDWKPELRSGAEQRDGCALQSDILYSERPNVIYRFHKLYRWLVSEGSVFSISNDVDLAILLSSGLGSMIHIILANLCIKRTFCLNSQSLIGDPIRTLAYKDRLIRRVMLDVVANSLQREHPLGGDDDQLKLANKGPSAAGRTGCLCSLVERQVRTKFIDRTRKIPLECLVWPKSLQLVTFTVSLMLVIFHLAISQGVSRSFIKPIIAKEKILINERSMKLDACRKWLDNATLISDEMKFLEYQRITVKFAGSFNSSFKSNVGEINGSEEKLYWTIQFDDWLARPALTLAYSCNEITCFMILFAITFYFSMYALTASVVEENVWAMQVIEQMKSCSRMCSIITEINGHWTCEAKRNLVIGQIHEASTITLINMRLFLLDYDSRRSYRYRFYVGMSFVIMFASLSAIVVVNHGPGPSREVSHIILNELSGNFNYIIILGLYNLRIITKYRIINRLTNDIVGYLSANRSFHGNLIEIEWRRMLLSDGQVQQLFGVIFPTLPGETFRTRLSILLAIGINIYLFKRRELVAWA